MGVFDLKNVMNERIDLQRELSYELIGLAMDVQTTYGSNHKEIIYQRALAEKLKLNNIDFVQEPKIEIFSADTRRSLGWYQPDLLVERKIIVELKATSYPAKAHEVQLRDYLKCSNIEIGYLLNFGLPSLYFQRIIYTNDRKAHTASV